MLGGGVYITQNKVLPGSYINFVNTANVTGAIGERGTVAIALPIGKAEGTVIELTRDDFVKNCKTILGKEYNSNDVSALREIFCHATKVYLYDLGASNTYMDVLSALEPYTFNVICAYTSESEAVNEYCTRVSNWRDQLGKKCQVVTCNSNINNHPKEYHINVQASVSNEDVDNYALAAWVAGATAGCKINESCTNMLYDGEYTIVTDKTQSQLESAMRSGYFTFHNVYGEVRVLEDINALTETTADKGEDFKNNQTIRIIDQIANDIAKLFNTKYLGKIPNNASGRVSLWRDVVAHHRELERVQAIENFDPTLVTVEQGTTKKSVVINDVITVTNCMSQLYMTVVVQ